MFAGFFYPMKISFTIPLSMKGMRLDQVISRSMEICSRSRASTLISQGRIQVDGRTKRPGYKVKSGDKVQGSISESEIDPRPAPETMALTILYEDDQILVVDKPPGQVVHPAPGHYTGTLVNGLLAHYPGFSADHWDPLRPGIVHRLDKDTSGLVLVAKTLQSHGFLQKEFKYRRVTKRYLALVQGQDIPDFGQIDLPIGRHPVKRKLMAVNHDIGKYARTAFKVIDRFDQEIVGALLDVRLYTGRTHQIRVHFYANEMSILGDRVYQPRRNRKAVPMASRQMLHAWKLKFRHPYSGLVMSFEAPLPPDFIQVMDQMTEPKEE